MRTKNLLMAVFALLGASCSQNEIMEMRQDADAGIGFDVYTGVATTKGTDVSTTTMQGACDESHYGGFGIMGYYTGQKAWEEAKGNVAPTFMFNQKVTYDAAKTTWTYSPTKYWPNNKTDKVSFFAYAPYESDTDGKRVGVKTSTIADKGTPSIEFTLKDSENLDKMVDLVVAEELNKTAESGAIEFNFRHILSKIGFQAKLGADYAGLDGAESFVYITHMWIVGKTETNSISVLTPKLTNSSSKFYTTAKWADLHWNYEDAVVAEQDYDLTNFLNREKDGITEIWEDGTEYSIQGIKLTSSNSSTAVNLFPENQYLYLIPVNDITTDIPAGETEGGCAKGDIQIGFHYDIVTKATNSAVDKPKYLVSHFESAVSLPEHHMKRGKWYTYTFTINLKAIEVSAAEVTAWGTASGNFPMQ